MAKVLLYNFTDSARREAVRLCASRLGLDLIDILPKDQGKTLGYMLGIPGYFPGTQVSPFSEEMIVFYNLPSPLLDLFLDCLLKNQIVVPLKAVVTSHNIGWSSERLYKELRAEHNAINRRQGPIHRK